jgi:hypothetical protein
MTPRLLADMPISCYEALVKLPFVGVELPLVAVFSSHRCCSSSLAPTHESSW